jgi:hypothetical protein
MLHITPGVLAQGAKNYIEQIPIKQKVILKSFMGSFTIGLFATQNIYSSVLSGVVGSVASLINATITPLFRALVENPKLTRSQLFTKYSISFLGTALFTSLFGNTRLLSHLPFYLFGHCCLSLTSEKKESTRQVQSFLIFLA